MSTRLTVFGVEQLPAVRSGDDIATLLAAAPDVDLRSGDVVVVTSKIVSKAEGRLVPGTREDHLAAQSARLVARRGDTRIVETHHGFVMAAAGIDASNVPAGTVALLPEDPDRSARAIRDGLRLRLGVEVAVVVSDTMGRPWRNGVVDVAIGAAGLDVLWDLRGEHDPAGHRLEATVVAVADELAGAADLVKGKLAGTPVAVVRGFPLQDNGSAVDAGARPLVRAAADDMFRLGTREAQQQVVRDAAPTAARGDGPADRLAVLRAVELLGPIDVTVSVSDDGTEVTVRGEPLSAGVCLGRLAVALAAEGLRGAEIEQRAHDLAAMTVVAG